MAGPPTANEAQLTFVFSGPGIPEGGVSTLGITSADRAIDGDLLNDLVPIIGLLHDSISTTTIVMDHIEMKRGPNETGPTYEAAVANTGGQAGAACPPNVCILVRKQLPNLSAKFSGRLFWPGVSENQVDDAGTISTAALNQYNAAFDTFHGELISAGVDPAVFSNSDLVSPVTIVSDFIVQSRVATQRRRMRR